MALYPEETYISVYNFQARIGGITEIRCAFIFTEFEDDTAMPLDPGGRLRWSADPHDASVLLYDVDGGDKLSGETWGVAVIVEADDDDPPFDWDEYLDYPIQNEQTVTVNGRDYRVMVFLHEQTTVVQRGYASTVPLQYLLTASSSTTTTYQWAQNGTGGWLAV